MKPARHATEEAARRAPSAAAAELAALPEAVAWWRTIPALPLLLTAVLAGFTLVPPARDNPRLVWTFAGAAGFLLAWEALLWSAARRRAGLFLTEITPVRSHWVQACVQFCILLYWGWFAREVYAELPLILAQVLFLYAFEGLVTWSRGRVWRLGLGPLPIVFSTNLLLWFKDDWFFLQFVMVALGALGKQFVTWSREGKRTHIFNPSAFGQFLVAVALIATGTTNDLTWGKQIAATFETPHMLVVIFLLGLVVQYLFHVTLMTLAACASLCAVNLVFHRITGTHYFVNTNIAAPIFLGIHLLVTDPSTSPRTNAGRIVFGGLYGLAYAALFWILEALEVPLFWDKLLPVPLLNLAVPLIDRAARGGLLGRLNRRWEAAARPGTLNLVHMGCWAALFVTLLSTRFIEAPHPGDSIPFWKQAVADGKPMAGGSLVMAAGAQAEGRGSGAAFNELGVICIEGQLVNENHGTAARYFARACELGDRHGCANAASQYLFLGEWRSQEDVARALAHLEEACAQGGDSLACFLAGTAYEAGRGRQPDSRRALELYARAGPGNLYACKGLARIVLAGEGTPEVLARLAPILEQACQAGDAESCWYLAHQVHGGLGAPRDERKARGLLEEACKHGLDDACRALQQAVWPPFAKPVMLVPNWATAFPLP